MRMTKEILSINVVVRRVKVGAAPFAWEVHGIETAEPVYVSPDRYSNMEAAYRAGQARLAEFVPSRRSTPGITDTPRPTTAGVRGNRMWRSRQNGLDAQKNAAEEVAQRVAQQAAMANDAQGLAGLEAPV